MEAFAILVAALMISIAINNLAEAIKSMPKNHHFIFDKPIEVYMKGHQ